MTFVMFLFPQTFFIMYVFMWHPFNMHTLHIPRRIYMKHISNKALLLVSALALIYTQNLNINTQLITALLLSVIAGTICPALIGFPALSHTKNINDECHRKTCLYVCEVIICIYLAATLKLHMIYLFSSIVSYDIYRYRQKFSAALLAMLSVYTMVIGPLNTVLPQISLVVFSLLLSGYSCHADQVRNELLSLRDNTTEHDMLVEQNTRQLLENQDNLILTATLSERNRIAREIHDTVGHMLTRSILQTGAIKVINSDDKLVKPLDQLQATLDTAMDSMRKSVHDLHDESVDLKIAISDMIAGVHGIDIHLDYDIGDSVPRDIKYSFINIIKESVNNTLKHSNGDHMNIKLREHPAFYQLYITDNGTDINIKQSANLITSSKGMGLFGIQERVNKLGGTMKICTDDGFSILITIMKRGDY